MGGWGYLRLATRAPATIWRSRRCAWRRGQPDGRAKAHAIQSAVLDHWGLEAPGEPGAPRLSCNPERTRAEIASIGARIFIPGQRWRSRTPAPLLEQAAAALARLVATMIR